MGRNDESYRADIIDKGITGVDVSGGVGRAPDRMQGVLGNMKPLVGPNGVPTSAERSDNTDPAARVPLQPKW